MAHMKCINKVFYDYVNILRSTNYQYWLAKSVIRILSYSNYVWCALNICMYTSLTFVHC
jgi:hypothetical protein